MTRVAMKDIGLRSVRPHVPSRTVAMLGSLEAALLTGKDNKKAPEGYKASSFE